MEPKKKRAGKNPKSKKKWTLEKKNQEKKAPKKYITFLWFKLISSINNNMKKRPA